MQIAALVLGCSLLGQSPPATLRPAAAPPHEPVAQLQQVQTPESRLPEAESPKLAEAKEPSRYRLTPPEMVAEAMVLPLGEQITGRPLTLQTALSAAGDRKRQLEVIHAYWRLAEAVSVYHFSSNHDRQLGQLSKFEGIAAQEASLLRTAQASSAALLREVEVAVVQAQHELAGLAMLPADAPLPLPADRPHVGPYVTHFNELFSRRSAPPAARLIDRTLPIRRRAIDSRASAVLAAADALTASADAYRQGEGEFSGVLICARQHLRQQQALIQSVCLYNHDIAEYAFEAVPPGTNGHGLVGMLIKPAGESIRPLANEDTSARPALPEADPKVEAAGHDQQLPTPAVRQTRPATTPPAEPDDTVSPLQVPKRAIVPVEPLPLKPALRQADKPVVEADSAAAINAAATVPPLYPALLDAAPGVRARQLALVLHWDRSLPQTAGPPIGLKTCLESCSSAERLSMIEAYWQARQRAAEYQVVVSQAELLDDLKGLVSRGDLACSARLHSAELTTAAAVRAAHVALLEAQFALARQIGRLSDSPWPIPSTVPHSGPYLLKIESQPKELIQSWPLRRLASTIPALAECMRDRAEAVVRSDGARAAAVAGYRNGTRSIEQALSAVSRQTDETLAFLQTLSDYNRAIAEYALAILPDAAAAGRVAAALVVL